MALTVPQKEPIAIVGSGCRFPGQANSPSKLWQLLHDPRDVLSEIGPDRFNANGFYHPDALHHGNSNAKHAYLLSEDLRQFDAKFFGIKGVEANAIDPQQRLLLETVYESIEGAGLQWENLRNSDTAVYVGQMCADYEAMLLRDLDSVPTYHATGVARSIMANRVSYFFDWHGPSLTIDTACSSSLVALHQAVQSLRSGETHLALAAGSNLILGPENYIAESKLKMLSPTGRSRMWDKDADGYARGEGVAAVVLKTLSAALTDGDHIECLIRETGVNQDGRTRGITMPSATAQTSLIRETYAKAGLDARNAADRCQYFEAHGTGTPTGDPLEAEAVAAAFFPDKTNLEPSEDGVLYVGSIKTVLGHTEGTAGLAGVLKASLALQHAVVPPNMLLNHLNPAIKPFYGNLQIPSDARPWPAVSAGQPRRASVNSFGFGGTNAHVILESYEPPQIASSSHVSPCFTPFTFSASTGTSLSAQLSAYKAYIADNPAVNLQDLSFSLKSRSVFPYKAAFAAQSSDELVSQIRHYQEKAQEGAFRSSTSESPAILGVFTGQGAQYPGMAADLLLSSSSARDCVQILEKSLSDLPEADKPQWSLLQELLTDASSSRVAEASLSQPLCTAVQILLVDILREAGVSFNAVVGHSSGEIGASYAAGFISAHDAIRIAYYRGLHSHLAMSNIGLKGAMIAVATSKEDAQEICDLPEFEGRITIAAVNSAASVTLSGDEDAIAEAKTVFTDENKKATILKVDKAYHSPHMTRCSDAYMQSMNTCQLNLQQTSNTYGSWYSSVYNKMMSSSDAGLKAAYWNDNLVRPVLFAQALITALEENPSVELVMEVGPHPALKGPASMNIQDALSRHLPYTSLLDRGKNSISALAEGLGYAWTRLGDRAINLKSVDRFLTGGNPGKLLKHLPSYKWDHDRAYWQESRVSRALRRRQDPVHELLGSKLPDSTGVQMSWKNLLRMKEVPWIQGHALQDQTVFPAAGYVATAIEASKHLTSFGQVRLIEIQDFVIYQPLVFSEDDLGVETLFSFVDIASVEMQGVISALFTYHSAASSESAGMTLMASGRLHMIIGTPSTNELPAQAPAEPNMIEVEADRFYASLSDIGYGYTGPFRALSNLERKLGKASGLVTNPKADGEAASLMIHPAMLDACIQAVILAFCYPNDGQLWSLHLPTIISRIKINPLLCASIAGKSQQLKFDSCISESSQSGVIGDVSVYVQNQEHALLQLEGMRAVPFTGATSENDINVFSTMTWGPASLSGEAAVGPSRASPEEYALASTLERVATFYLRMLDGAVSKNHPARQTGPYVGYFKYVTHVIDQVSESRHPYAKREWMEDTLESILDASKAFIQSPDLKIMHVIGREMPRVIHGETTILEHLLPNGLLDSYYSNALGFPQFTTWLSRMTAQLTHRYPRMDVLEIGAGTGGATKGIFKECKGNFSSYTFTDISNGFFETARDTFKDDIDRMAFKVLDIEKDTTAQGFEDHSYDLIIASFVLHATARLEHTMQHVRRLLKPGGRLLMAEVTNNDQIRGGFIFGALPGWWLGAEDGRVLSPCVSPAEWDNVLRKTGFSGVDTITHELDRFPYPGSVIAAQAVDPQVNFLRRPLSASYPQDLGRHERERLIIVGGASLKTRVLIEELSEILLASYPQIEHVQSIADIFAKHFSGPTAVLCLSELEKPVFKDTSPQEFQGLKVLFSQESTMMWVTEGRRARNPESNMIYGFARSQQWEVPGLHLQFIDLETPLTRGAHVVAEGLVRLSQLVAWEKAGRLENVVWSLEPELVLNNDDFLIPRLAPNLPANERLNSAKRQITRKRRDNEAGFFLKEGALLRPLETDLVQSPDIEHVDVDVEYSTACSVKTLAGRGYIAIGKTAVDRSPVVIITDSQASRVRVLRARMAICKDFCDQSRLLMLVAHHLFADYLVSKVYPGETLLVHEAGNLLAQILERRLDGHGAKLLLTTSEVDHRNLGVCLHPFATDNEIRKLLPGDISLYIDMSKDLPHSSLGRRLALLLPRASSLNHAKTPFGDRTRLPPDNLAQESQAWLEQACTRAADDWDTAFQVASCGDVTNAGNLSNKQDAPQLFDQIHWTHPTTASIVVQPVDSSLQFTSQRTYWLVGLTGGLGLSLCEWMVRHGARYVVISSRHPKVDDRWSKNMLAAGASVKIASCDLTSRNAVGELYQEIVDTFPPIAGVAQGAMVLQDVPTRDMTFQDLDRVLKPKVEGSRYLDELFQQNTLDFFVFFSSMTGVIGNMGQSNYTAANTFMCALARQRREKGLAASVINIGVIIGVGYVTRKVSHADQKNLRKGGYMWMSERDFHQIFAESVLASRPDSGLDPEISTGLRCVEPDDPYMPIWYNNPIFSKCILQKQATATRESPNALGPPINVRLQAAKNQSEVAMIVQDCFTLHLQTLLGGESNDVSVRLAMLDTRTDELGVDSLIAVEIRSWFSKNLSVNVPVLKILSGATVRVLLQFVLNALPQTLVPCAINKVQDTPQPTDPVPSVDAVASQLNKQEPDLPSSKESLMDQHAENTDSESPNASTPASSIVEDEELGEAVLSKSVIPCSHMQRHLPMSFSQSMFWFVTAFLQDKTTLNHFGSSRVHGRLRVPDLEKAVDIVAQRHEALRTCFFIDDTQQPTQGILETSPIRLEYKRIEHEVQLKEECAKLKKHSYDLAKGETMRFILLSKTIDEHYLLIGCHHINIDGISHQVLMSDLLKAYEYESLPIPVLQYADYSILQRQKQSKEGWKAELTYWRQELADYTYVLPILSPSAVTLRRPLHDYTINRIDARINPAIALRIKDTCRRNRTTPFHFYLAVFKSLLFRLSGAEDLVIGIGDANRSEQNMLEAIGPFVNLLPLRFRISGAQRFEDTLQEARSKTYDALSNAGVPFEVLLAELDVVRSAAYSPLFQAFIDYRQGAKEKMSFGECQLETIEFEAGKTAYDLSLDIIDDAAGQPLLMMMTQASLYSKQDTQILLDSYVNLLEAFAKEPGLTLNQAPLYKADDAAKALEVGRGKSPPTVSQCIAYTASRSSV